MWRGDAGISPEIKAISFDFGYVLNAASSSSVISLSYRSQPLARNIPAKMKQEIRKIGKTSVSHQTLNCG